MRVSSAESRCLLVESCDAYAPPLAGAKDAYAVSAGQRCWRRVLPRWDRVQQQAVLKTALPTRELLQASAGAYLEQTRMCIDSERSGYRSAPPSPPAGGCATRAESWRLQCMTGPCLRAVFQPWTWFPNLSNVCASHQTSTAGASRSADPAHARRGDV